MTRRASLPLEPHACAYGRDGPGDSERPARSHRLDRPARKRVDPSNRIPDFQEEDKEKERRRCIRIWLEEPTAG
ncbi:hypothetical protein HMPREF0043_00261 [Actinobaculum sp. oral taxon 183 str. F0552]|nr:hypothetical protein HMPREF0043_00261 [Actinobaculum sp. oral taxon 183 str. F0552]